MINFKGELLDYTKQFDVTRWLQVWPECLDSSPHPLVSCTAHTWRLVMCIH